MPWGLLITASLGTFLVAASSITRTPFMLDMARDLGTTLAAIAHLFSLLIFPLGVVAPFAGVLSDRWGRRPLLVVGVALLGASMLATALTPGYAAVAVLTLLGGVGAGIYMGVVFAAVADRVEAAQRGRALGWIINGQSLGLLIAVPAASWLGAFVGWRGVFAGVGGSLLALIAWLWRVMASDKLEVARPGAWGPLAQLATPRMAALLAAATIERLCFGVVVVFMPTFLITRHDVSVAEVALPIAVIALGNISGNAAGAKLADMTHRRMALFGATSFAVAVLALLLFVWPGGLGHAIAVGVVFAFVNALGRPALMAVLSQVPGSMRGAVMGLTMACASVGWISAASLGAVAIDHFGFASLGWFAAAAALVGVALSVAPNVMRSDAMGSKAPADARVTSPPSRTDARS